MSKQINLYDLLNNQSIKNFADRLRVSLGDISIKENGETKKKKINDYASLVELEYVETKEDFIEVIKKFLRRYTSILNQLEKKEIHLKKISENDLIEIGRLIDQYGPKLVRSALISLALCKRSEQE